MFAIRLNGSGRIISTNLYNLRCLNFKSRHFPKFNAHRNLFGLDQGAFDQAYFDLKNLKNLKKVLLFLYKT